MVAHGAANLMKGLAVTQTRVAFVAGLIVLLPLAEWAPRRGAG